MSKDQPPKYGTLHTVTDTEFHNNAVYKNVFIPEYYMKIRTDPLVNTILTHNLLYPKRYIFHDILLTYIILNTF